MNRLFLAALFVLTGCNQATMDKFSKDFNYYYNQAEQQQSCPSYTPSRNGGINVDLCAHRKAGYTQGQIARQQLEQGIVPRQQALPQCSSMSLAPLANVGCKYVCINGQWAEVCGGW